MSTGLGADLAVSDTVINPAVSCCYFPHVLHSQLQASLPVAGANYTAWWQRHTGVSSFRKATALWCPGRTQTREL